MSINPESVKKILVVRNDRFGEFLLNIPALRALKETYPQARLIAVVNPYTRELAQDIAFIDEVIQWAREEHSLIERLRLIRTLREKRIDIAVMLNPSQEFNIVTYLSGIPIRAGYARKWGFLLSHKMEDKKYLGLKNEIEYNLELVDLIGAKTKDKSLFLNTDDSAIRGLLDEYDIRKQDNLIAVHPFTSDPIKQWPMDNFIELAKRLAKEGIKIIIVGGKDNLEKYPWLFETFKNSGVINLIGRTTLRQLAAFLKVCRLLVSGDSGPMHLACAVNTPVVAIFRNDIPGKTAKRWGPWQGQSQTIEKDNLSEITVDEVFNKVKEVLG